MIMMSQDACARSGPPRRSSESGALSSVGPVNPVDGSTSLVLNNRWLKLAPSLLLDNGRLNWR